MGAEDLTVEGAGTTPVEEGQTPGEGQVQEPQTVPVEVIQKMREEMQQLKDDLKNRDMSIQFLQGQIMQGKKPEEPPMTFEDDDLLSAGDVRRLIASEMKAVRETQDRERGTRRQMELAAMEADIRTRYPDYDELFKLAEEQTRKNPGMTEKIMAMHNPYEGVVQAAQLNPSYLEKLKTKETKAAGEQIAKNLGKTKTLAEIGGGGEIKSKPNYLDMVKSNPEQLRKEFNRIVHGD